MSIRLKLFIYFRTSIYSTSSSDQEGSGGVVISTLETVPRTRQQQSLGEIEMISSINNGDLHENQTRQPEEGSTNFSNSSQN